MIQKLVRGYGRQLEKWFYPDSIIQNNLELAQLDNAKASKELVKFHKQDLASKAELINHVTSLKGTAQLSNQALNSLHTDMRKYQEASLLLEVKSLEELRSMNQNIGDGFSSINSSLVQINESILLGISRSQESLSKIEHYLTNPKAKAIEKARLQLTAAEKADNPQEKEENALGAIQLYEKGLQDDIEQFNYLAHIELGYAYFKYTDHLEKAKLSFKSAVKYCTIEKADTNRKTEAIKMYSWLCFLLGEYEEAETKVNVALEINQDPILLLNKSLYCIHNGKESESLSILKEALEQDKTLLANVVEYLKFGYINEYFLNRFIEYFIDEYVLSIQRIFERNENLLRLSKKFLDEYRNESVKSAFKNILKMKIEFESNHGKANLSPIQLMDFVVDINSVITQLSNNVLKGIKEEKERSALSKSDIRSKIDRIQKDLEIELRNNNSKLYNTFESHRSGKYQPYYLKFINDFTLDFESTFEFGSYGGSNPMKIFRVLGIISGIAWAIYGYFEWDWLEDEILLTIIMSGVFGLLGAGVGIVVGFFLQLIFLLLHYILFTIYYSVSQNSIMEALEEDLDRRRRELKPKYNNLKSDLLHKEKQLIQEMKKLNEWQENATAYNRR